MHPFAKSCHVTMKKKKKKKPGKVIRMGTNADENRNGLYKKNCLFIDESGFDINTRRSKN